MKFWRGIKWFPRRASFGWTKKAHAFVLDGEVYFALCRPREGLHNMQVGIGFNGLKKCVACKRNIHYYVKGRLAGEFA